MAKVPGWATGILFLLIGTGVIVGVSYGIAYVSYDGNVVTDALGIDRDVFRDTDGDGLRDIVDPDDDNDGILDLYDDNPKVPDEIITLGQVVPIKLDIYRRGVEATDPDPTCYVWYDWDENGEVNTATFEGLDEDGDPIGGEIETVSAASGTATTTQNYPVGKWVYWQMHKSGYEVKTVKTKVPTPGPGWDSTSALSVGSTWLMMTETDSTDRVRVLARGTGSVLMVTESTDYNYTLYGASPTLDVSIHCATDDMGIGTDDYYDWSTGDQYKGSFMAIAVTYADNPDVTFGGYDDVKQDGTYFWYIWDLDEGIWNDAAEDDDGTITRSFGATIRGDFDIAYINVFHSLKQDTYDAGSLLTGQTLQETNLDFIGV